MSDPATRMPRAGHHSPIAASDGVRTQSARSDAPDGVQGRVVVLLGPGVERVPGKRGGRPCIVGTRIEVEMLHALWREGYTFAQIREMYPDVQSNHVLAAAIGFWSGVRFAREGGDA